MKSDNQAMNAKGFSQLFFIQYHLI